MLARVSDRIPLLYIEHARLEVDDSSVKVLAADGVVTRIPCATVACICLGPGTSITHEAIKTMAKANCVVNWVAEDSLVFYATGITPTSDSRNFLNQARLAMDPKLRTDVAKVMFTKRFPKSELEGKGLNELMGMEGSRVKSLYLSLAEKHGVVWSGRRSESKHWQAEDAINRYMTAFNAALYAICNSVICSLGYSPHLGFVHSGSPTPFTYDIADLYKESLCIIPAFELGSLKLYDKDVASSHFREVFLKQKIIEKIPTDIEKLMRV
jgi:CRISPR-associated protein Cas1